MVSYRTPRARVRRLGSAKGGTSSFIRERVTGLALVPLTLWGVWGALEIARTDWVGATLWIGQPINAVMVSLLIAVGFWHMSLGLRVIVEDYIHRTMTKSVLLIANVFLCAAAAALAIFCVLKVAFMGAGA